MPRRYHPVLVGLHWLLAILILAGLFGGTFELSKVPNSDPLKLVGLQIHMTIGLSILALMLIRLVVRLRTAHPAPVETGNLTLDRLGRVMHAALYLVAIAMAASGMALSVTSGLPDAVFGTGTLPATFDAFFARRVHGALANLLGLLVLAHVAAALWHQFVRRDALFRRMWFGAR